MFYMILDKLEKRAGEIFVGKQAWQHILEAYGRGLGRSKQSERTASNLAAE
jgi:hypothetical protein